MANSTFRRDPVARKFTPVCRFHRRILLRTGMREWVRDREAVLLFLTVTSLQQVCDNCEVGLLVSPSATSTTSCRCRAVRPGLTSVRGGGANSSCALLEIHFIKHIHNFGGHTASLRATARTAAITSPAEASFNR